MSEISIAEAKNQLPSLLRKAESGEPIRITRRGRAVAVILSLAEYESLVEAAQNRPSLGQAISSYRRSARFDGEVLPEEVDTWRDRSNGREIPWRS